jgi:hypothetical protein
MRLKVERYEEMISEQLTALVGSHGTIPRCRNRAWGENGEHKSPGVSILFPRPKIIDIENESIKFFNHDSNANSIA